MMRIPGPIDQIRNFQNINDGTLARQPSRLPGPLNLNAPAFSTGKYTPTKPFPPMPPMQVPPSSTDHFGYSNSRLHNELWFEKRIPNLLAHTYSSFVSYINSWVKKNPKKNTFDGKTLRTSVDKAGQPFEKYGDVAQSFYEKGAVLGHYSIDFESPFPIEHSSGGGYKWETQMYVEDVLGAGDIRIIKYIAPNRRVKRAKWLVQVK
jgi:hypothetical protein